MLGQGLIGRPENHPKILPFFAREFAENPLKYCIFDGFKPLK
jgi:hypothetical protein